MRWLFLCRVSAKPGETEGFGERQLPLTEVQNGS